MMQASDPKQCWWMTITERLKETNRGQLAPTEATRETAGGHRRVLKATGWPRMAPWMPQSTVPAHRFGPGLPNLVL